VKWIAHILNCRAEFRALAVDRSLSVMMLPGWCLNPKGGVDPLESLTVDDL
jgi:hypothetical protein